MGLVAIDPAASGLGAMLGGLLQGNLDAHPARARLVRGARGTVNITATDAGASCGLRFTGSAIDVSDAHPRADLDIATTSEILMGLTAVPLRFGLPDALTAEGRRVVGLLASRKLRVRGLVQHLGLMARVQRLLAVSA